LGVLTTQRNGAKSFNALMSIYIRTPNHSKWDIINRNGSTYSNAIINYGRSDTMKFIVV